MRSDYSFALQGKLGGASGKHAQYGQDSTHGINQFYVDGQYVEAVGAGTKGEEIGLDEFGNQFFAVMEPKVAFGEFQGKKVGVVYLHRKVEPDVVPLYFSYFEAFDIRYFYPMDPRTTGAQGEGCKKEKQKEKGGTKCRHSNQIRKFVQI